MRRNRNQISLSLIDWTIASNALEINNHQTKNELDMFSDHVPIEFQVKIDYTKKNVKNEINKL